MSRPTDKDSKQMEAAIEVMARRRGALRQLALAEQIMRDDRDILHALAKGKQQP